MKFPALLVVCFAAVFSEFIEAVRNQTDDHSYRTLFCYQSGLDDPKLARQLRFRVEYNAACAALLCAAGKVEEGADSPEAAKLRKQALEWLTTNLATWKRMMEKKPQARAAGMKQLRHWQTDADLANVRGPEINGLREEEREGWRELWAEVNRVLDAGMGLVSTRVVGKAAAVD